MVSSTQFNVADRDALKGAYANKEPMKAFPNLERSLKTSRVLKAYNYARYLRVAPREIMRVDCEGLPQIVYEQEEFTCFRTSSYGRKPGEGVYRIEDLLQNTLPDDFREFYSAYAEALVVTRSYPIHLWSIDKMFEWFSLMRYAKPYPLRFIRFGDYWDLETTQFALWKNDPQKADWWVVTTSVNQHDDQYDALDFKDYYRVGTSFSGWLEDWIARDGLPDPFMDLDSGGGFLDPV